MLRTLVAFGVAALGMHSALAADWYVDGKYGSDSHSGSRYSPFKSVWKGWSRAQPGDTVHLLPTITYGPIWLGGKSGYSGKNITLKGDGSSSNMTKVSGNWQNHAIVLENGRHHITIQNLDVTAPGHSGNGPYSAILAPRNHHIWILNNYTHDAGCAGIQTTNSDYITISGNRVANNSKDTKNYIYCSGISNHENLDVDGNTGTKMWITNNVIWGNTNKPTPGCWGSKCYDSDGSGIIVDDSRRTQSDWKKYRGATLIQNNVIAGNGGRGVHVYSSDNVRIYSNTMYQNNRDPHESGWHPGEISVVKSGGVNIYNNILHTDGNYNNSQTGNRVSLSVMYASGGAISADYNLMYNWKNDWNLRTYAGSNNTSVHIGGNNRFGNPYFKSPNNNASWANFRVTGGSKAYSFWSPSWSFPTTDFLGWKRSSPVTAGAYQYGA
ncbi:MAG: hypothetical protein ACTHL1_10595 [Burkholderiaceae bacterium]